MPDTERSSGRLRLAVRALGPLRVHAGRHQLQLPAKKAQALFAYLALRAGRPHEREALYALLWPNSPRARAQASLRQALATIRRALPRGARSALRLANGTVSLDALLVTSDVTAIERDLTEGTLPSLERAAGLFGGPLLEGLATGEDVYDDWLSAERERLNQRMLEGLERLAELQAAARRPEQALQTALHALRLEPFEERTHRLVMRLYASQGRRAEAIQHYEACAELLERELGVAPDEATQAVFRGLSNGSATPVFAIAAPARTPATPCVGRRVELDWLAHAVARVGKGERRLFVLEGEAGVGKTRLLEALRTEVTGNGGLCLRGRCFESERILPFALWVDLLRDAGATLDDARSQLSAASRSELTRLLPEWRAQAEEPPPAGADARALFEALAVLLARAADGSRLILLLEDVHWADGTSLRLLSFLVRRIPAQAPVGVFATVRAEEIGASPDLRRVLGELRRENQLSQRSLGALGRAETLELVRTVASDAEVSLSDDTCDQIWRISEGNPLIATECVRGLRDAPRSELATKVALPERVRALVLEHVDHLTPPAREALAAAAVIGREFEYAWLSAVLCDDPRALARACEELVQRRLLRLSDRGLDFAHDRIRAVVYASLLPGRRASLHGAVARALASCSSERIDQWSGTIGHHYARAGQRQESVDFLLRFAARAVRDSGFEQALDAIAAAEAQCPELPEALREARRLELALQRCACLMHLGLAEQVEPALAPLRATVERLAEPGLSGPFHAWLALAKSFLGDGAQAIAHGTVAIAAAERCGDRQTAGLSHSVLSLEASHSGQFQRGVAHGREAIERFDPARSDPDFIAFAYLHLGYNQLSLGEIQLALDAFAHAREIGERTGSHRLEAISRAMVGAARLCMGDLDGCLASSRQALSIAPDPHSVWLCRLLLVRATAFAASLHGDARALREEPCASALTALERSLGVTGQPSMRGFAGRAMVVLAEAYLASDDLARAGGMLARAVESPRLAADPFGVAVTLRTRARVELAAGDLERAAADADQATQGFEALEARFDSAVTRLTAAQIASARGDHTSVARELAAAQRTFAALDLADWPTRLVAASSAQR